MSCSSAPWQEGMRRQQRVEDAACVSAAQLRANPWPLHQPRGPVLSFALRHLSLDQAEESKKLQSPSPGALLSDGKAAGDASRLRLGVKSQRVCSQQRILPVVSGRAAPSRKAPSSVSPSVISSKPRQCKRPFALCLSVTSI